MVFYLHCFRLDSFCAFFLYLFSAFSFLLAFHVFRRPPGGCLRDDLRRARVRSCLLRTFSNLPRQCRTRSSFPRLASEFWMPLSCATPRRFWTQRLPIAPAGRRCFPMRLLLLLLPLSFLFFIPRNCTLSHLSAPSATFTVWFIRKVELLHLGAPGCTYFNCRQWVRSRRCCSVHLGNTQNTDEFWKA